MSVATLFTAVTILALGVAVVARARASFITVIFLAMTVSAAGWLAAFSAMYASNSAEQALAWARVAAFFSSLLPAAIFHFATAYLGRRSDLRSAVIFSWSFCFMAGTLLAATPYFVPGVYRYSWGFYTHGSTSICAFVT